MILYILKEWEEMSVYKNIDLKHLKRIRYWKMSIKSKALRKRELLYYVNCEVSFKRKQPDP